MPLVVTSAPDRVASRSAASVPAPAWSRAVIASRRPGCSQATTSRIVLPLMAAASRVAVRTCSPAAWKNGSRRSPPMLVMKCPARRAAASTRAVGVGVGDAAQRVPPPGLLDVGDALRVERPHGSGLAAHRRGQGPEVGLVGGGDDEPGCGQDGGDGDGAGLVRAGSHDDEGDVFPGHPHLGPADRQQPNPPAPRCRVARRWAAVAGRGGWRRGRTGRPARPASASLVAGHRDGGRGGR